MPYQRDILNISDFDKADFDYILSVAGSIAENPGRYGEVAKGKLLATLFFEPSTRTRLSFESAMLRMGGQVLGFSEAGVSSTAKGETPEDTARTVSGYCDIMVVRHPTALVPIGWQGYPMCRSSMRGTAPTSTPPDPNRPGNHHRRFGRLII